MRIEDHALVGDTRTAALVGRDGSVDWLCLLRLDAGACFASLLGGPEHGRWLLAPRGGVRGVRRRHRDATLVLETEFRTGEGVVRLIDLMPLRDGREPRLIRIVEGVSGRVPMRMELVVRFDHGSVVPWVRRRDRALLGTVAAVERHPFRGWLVLRDGEGSQGPVDGLRRGECALLPCSFWPADNLAMRGRTGEARALFGRLLDLRNDVGLLAEEHDTARGRLEGNFPQAFSHVGLVNTARNLAGDGPAARRGEHARTEARA